MVWRARSASALHPRYSWISQTSFSSPRGRGWWDDVGLEALWACSRCVAIADREQGFTLASLPSSDIDLSSLWEVGGAPTRCRAGPAGFNVAEPGSIKVLDRRPGGARCGGPPRQGAGHLHACGIGWRGWRWAQFCLALTLRVGYTCVVLC